MKRRDFIISLAAAVSCAVPGIALARITCGPFVPPGVQQCEAGLDSSLAKVAARVQKASQWCWAACIEMVFRYYGFFVPQTRIVEETWGSIDDLPGTPEQILADLNRPWIDVNGRRFGVSGDVISANPITAAQDLAQDMPLIIGTMGHAMVLTSLTYIRDQFGRFSVMAAVVRDPWPRRGRRVLSPQEWHSTNFLVRIRVFPA